MVSTVCAHGETGNCLRKKRKGSSDEMLSVRLSLLSKVVLWGQWMLGKGSAKLQVPPGLCVQWSQAFHEGHEDTTLWT